MPPEPDPPYLRIVTEIRRRIADGELAPGGRVPSTRQIAKEWGVALATATKALTTLRLDGLVEGPEHELTRERIVRAAIEIADSEGLAALSMRGVAARLGVAAMSPYRHVGSKEDLVLLMADTAFGEKSYPADPPTGWRPRLELAARTLWALYRNHPWLTQTGPLTRPLLLPNLMVHAEWVLATLDGHGLDPTTVLDLHVLLYSYVQGIAASLEQEAQAEAATGLSEDEWMDRQSQALQAITTSPRYPTFTRITASLPNGYDLRLDELFEFGLGPLLDGIAGIIEDR
ncbi:putative transcriptional regulator, GntR family protein [Streptomyces bingchenggensis BCW-1]|uniref:Putative transcriptional regulator, GntR family protein n=1 Tax=Streptomyces bingchenggensis (strain BCW-1) TaxID=749414 RepID=D7CF23_STRBB|nr:TetR/AcrR family transcriptional regulator C-terminal domain-containing protein [Streptomyces bingchenggensis]ADI11045.1 putative transcriptional regulator, GntR family protein [Streptomyces bingchenggensis BCW-1]